LQPTNTHWTSSFLDLQTIFCANETVVVDNYRALSLRYKRTARKLSMAQETLESGSFIHRLETATLIIGRVVLAPPSDPCTVACSLLLFIPDKSAAECSLLDFAGA